MRSAKPSPSPRSFLPANFSGTPRSVGLVLAIPFASLVLANPAAAQGNWDPADSDGDGLPDAFEEYYFGAGNLSQTAEGDPDGDTVPNSLELAAGRNPTLAQTTTGTPDWHGVPGALRLERWNGVAGSTLQNLYAASVFPAQPGYAGFTTAASVPSNQADNYGTRIRGWLTAPASGDYRFHIAGDDQCQLWLGTDATRFTKRPLCRVDSWSQPGAYTATSAQQSGLIALVAGQSYYFEAIMKEGGGADHLSVGWTRPGQTVIETIPGKLADGTVVLTSEIPDPADADDDGNPDAWETSKGLNPASAADHAFLDSDSDGFNNLLEYQTQGDPLATGGNTGYCEWRSYNIGPNNNSLSALTSSPLFARDVAAWSGWFTRTEADPNAGDNFGRRLRCVVTIPVAGTYYFHIAGDDSCALWINPAGPSRFGKTRVAVSTHATSYRQFTAKTTQKSKAFTFAAGAKVYLEALYVEGLGADHCSVAWTGPGITAPTVIPSAQISTCAAETINIGGTLYDNDADNDSIPDDWEAAHGLLVTNAETTALANGEYGDPDGDGIANFIEYQNNTDPKTAQGAPGKWTHEFYAETGGSRVADLIGTAGILRGPDQVRLSADTDVFRDSADNYGQRFRATITPPVTGSYTFWITGDDGAELWLSPDGRKFSKRRIAFIDDLNATYSYASYRQWDKVPGQKSAPVALAAGQSYYIEILHKEGSGGDHVGLAWSLAGGQPEGGYLPVSAASAATVAAGISLADVTGASGTMKGSWIPNQTAASTHFFTNDGAVATFQLQFFDGTYTKAAKVQLTRSGSAITAHQIYGKYKSGNVLGQNFDTLSASSAPVGSGGYGVNTLSLSGAAGVLAFSGAVVPASALTSFVRDADDLDDDCLVDSWESQNLAAGSPLDNGLSNPSWGEYGDPDGDSVINRDEWLLGTLPGDADTDNDGYPDGQEIYFLGTNPLVPETTAPAVNGSVSIQAFANASATWVPTGDGGVLSMENRGWIDYTITAGEAGYYLFEIVGRARGSSIAAREDFPLEISIDGTTVASTILTSLNGDRGLAAGFAGWLAQGSHTIRVWNRNLLGRRALQLDSIRLVLPTGASTNTQGLPDWVYDLLASRNALATTAQSSFTSPFCLEGIARDWSLSAVSANGGAAGPVSRGTDNRWFANVDLSATGSTSVSATHEGALIGSAPVEIVWEPFNIASGLPLTVRKGDKLRLTAFTPGTEPDGSAVTLLVAGQAIGTTPANQPLVHTFGTAGTIQVGATNASGVTFGTTAVTVLSADFGPAFPVYLNRSRVWNLPGVAATLPLETDRTLLLTQGAASGAGRTCVADTTALGTNTVLARNIPGGPVLATGQVTGTLLSHSNDYEIPTLFTYPNGDRIVEMTVFASSLPPGGYIKLEIWLGGRVFVPSNTTVLNLTAADFDENGVARVRMLLSSGIGTTCHRTYLYDANNNLIGQM